MNETNYVVYRHTSPNGRVYIGITSRKPEYRWNNGKGYKNQILFYRSIQKYGWNNFKHEILYSGLNEVSAKLIEEDLIYYYKKLNISLNITDGGEGSNGYKHTEELKKRFSESKKAENNVFYGKHHSEEFKKRISELNSKSVLQYSISGILIATYNSIKEAFLNTGINNISKCCNKKQKTAGGFIWKFKLKNK